jgi:hypothetical protein
MIAQLSSFPLAFHRLFAGRQKPAFQLSSFSPPLRGEKRKADGLGEPGKLGESQKSDGPGKADASPSERFAILVTLVGHRHLPPKARLSAVER